MATLLSSHLEQISLCSQSIADLSFPGPKVFTNALLSTHEVTSLIRDTEQHERALFHLAAPPLPPKNGPNDFGMSIGSSLQGQEPAAKRRATTYGAARQPRSKAVAAVLGGELYAQTRPQSDRTRQKGDLDVEVLLHGAEKLAAVYPIPGAVDKIAQLRRRHQQLAANIAHYEAKVNEQARELATMNRPSNSGAYFDEDEESANDMAEEDTPEPILTRADLEREEQEVRALEDKKRALEERVEGMEKDLTGLIR